MRLNSKVARPEGPAGSARPPRAAFAAAGERRRRPLHQDARLAARRRHLASNQRAGRFSRGVAWQRLLATIRQDWAGLLVLLLTPPPLMLPQARDLSDFGRGAMLGAAGMAGVSLAVIYVLVVSGAAASAMGTAGEQWTAEDLRAMRRRGWRLINGLTMHDRSDVDHVAIGPAGIVVVETKWSAHPWPEPGERGFMSNQIAGYVEQARRNRWAIHGVFSRARQGAPVRAALVLQSPTKPIGSSTPWYDLDGVTVVRGDALRRWLASLDSSRLHPDDVERVWAAMSQHIHRRDTAHPAGSTLARHTIVGLMLRYGAQPVAGVWLSLLAVRVPFLLGGWRVGVGGMLGLTAAGVWGLRSRRLKPLAVGWLAALAFAAVLVVGDWVNELL